MPSGSSNLLSDGTPSPSPAKGLKSLTAYGIIRLRDLQPSTPGLPKSTHDLYSEISRQNKFIAPSLKACICTCHHVINISCGADTCPIQTEFSTQGYHIPSFFFADKKTWDAGVDPSPPPQLDDMLGVQEWATRLSERQADEAAWNCIVHSQLLKLALHGGSRIYKDGLVDVVCWYVSGALSDKVHRKHQDIADIRLVPSTSASISKEYLPASAPGKKVDFVMSITPPEIMTKDIQLLRRSTPTMSVNHTDHDPLFDMPIAVSIETKRAGGNDAEAKLQLGLWLAAHWNFLAKRANDEELAELGFLPGVIIKGHDWAFMGASRSEDTTVRLG